MEREALKRALAVMQINLTLLEKVDPYDDQEDLLSDSLDLTHKAIATVKTALAQTAQEPDAYQSGFYDGKKAARARCIELVLSGTGEPVQTRTLEILQEERKRIAKLIEEDGKT